MRPQVYRIQKYYTDISPYSVGLIRSIRMRSGRLRQYGSIVIHYTIKGYPCTTNYFKWGNDYQ